MIFQQSKRCAFLLLTYRVSCTVNRPYEKVVRRDRLREICLSFADEMISNRKARHSSCALEVHGAGRLFLLVKREYFLTGGKAHRSSRYVFSTAFYSNTRRLPR